MLNNTTDIYDYGSAGFDAFLNRSIDISSSENSPYATLSLIPPLSTGQQVNYDQMQVNGSLGDSLKVGRVQIDGSNGQITVSDGENIRIVMGFSQDSF